MSSIVFRKGSLFSLCFSTSKYWVGPKVHSGFSITSYGNLNEFIGHWPTQFKNTSSSPDHSNCVSFRTLAFKRTNISSVQFSSVAQSCPTLCDPMKSQHARPPCLSPTPGVHSDSRPSSQWCHPAISSSVVPFFSCPQSLPASKSFPMSQLFTWGGRSTGVSALVSFPLKKSQGWSPSEWTGWISLQSKGLSRVFSNTTVQKHQFFGAQPSSQSHSHIHTWPQEKP